MSERGLLSLGVKNFGILGDVQVSLGRLNVLVGPNGSGKTTLLRVIEFIGNASRTKLEPAIELHGGFQHILTRRPPRRSQSPSDIVIRVEAAVTRFAHARAPDEYELRLSPVGRSAFRHREFFRFKRTAKQGRRITLAAGKIHFKNEAGGKESSRKVSSDAFGLAVLPELAPEEGGAEIRKIQQLFTTFRVFDLDVNKARQPALADQNPSLAADGSNLAAFLAFLAERHSNVFEELVDDARAIVPGLEGIDLRPVGGAARGMIVEIRDHALPGRTPLAFASFGTVRALGLLAMLHDPAPPLLTCVEEIDHGLHPYAFDRLVDLLRAASRRTQILIATHSPALVNRLAASELIVCERDEESGLARIPAVDAEEMAAKMNASELRLGELWFSGALGGVPR